MAITYWQDDTHPLVWELDDTKQTPEPGWTPSTLTAYNANVAARQADIDAAVAALKLAHCLARKAVYDDLKAIHAIEYSEATYRALSGYTPGDC